MGSSLRVFSTSILIFSVLSAVNCDLSRIPVGVLLGSEDNGIFEVLKNVFDQLKSSQVEVEIVAEKIGDFSDSSRIDKAVCRLLKRGVFVLIAPTTCQPLLALTSYSKEFKLVLVSTSSSDVPRELASPFSFFVQPGTAGVTLTMLHRYKWEEVVYVYDESQGPTKLQDIFHLGFGAVKWGLVGLLKVESALHANQYFRQLEQSGKYRQIHVILDTDPILARDIIVRHVHDMHVGKNNFHFLITTPITNEFWISEAPKFGVVNVTMFSAQPPVDRPSKYSPRVDATKRTALNVTSYLYHDAAYIVGEGLRLMYQISRSKRGNNAIDCRSNERNTDFTETASVIGYIKKAGSNKSLVTGKMIFNSVGQRENFSQPVLVTENLISRQLGVYDDNGFKGSHERLDFPLLPPPSRNVRRKYKITTILNPPFLMLRNSSSGKNGYEGYAKDLIELLAAELDFDYDLTLVKDGKYGWYDQNSGEWTGMIGEVVRGEADMAIADIHVTVHRHRVVDFAEIAQTSSLSVLLKSPSAVETTSRSFFVQAFSTSIWICILVVAAVVVGLFYAMSRFIGEPDNIEAASGIWRRPSHVVGNVWFVVGSSLLQGTGIYPRSISSRLLGGSWWCFSLIVLALFVASLTSQMGLRFAADGDLQLARLTSLSLESVVRESTGNGWPRLGIAKRGTTLRYVKESSLPFLKEYVTQLATNPDLLLNNVAEGVQKLQASDGGFGVLLESTHADYLVRTMPCEAVSIRDVIDDFLLGIPVPLGSPLRTPLKAALTKLKMRGDLSHLRQKWITYKTVCHRKREGTTKNLHYFSGFFYFLLVGLIAVIIVGLLQHFWKIKNKDGKRQRLSFEELSLGQNLPLPPPELLRDSPEGDNGPIDGWAERRMVPTSFQRSNTDTIETARLENH